MARPLRVHIPGALSHVMSRGNARQPIFIDTGDYTHFLGRLAITTARFRVRCRARDFVYAERFACRPPLAQVIGDMGDADTLDHAMWVAFEQYGYTAREIAKIVGRPPATVWRRIRRAAGRCAAESSASEKIEI